MMAHVAAIFEYSEVVLRDFGCDPILRIEAILGMVHQHHASYILSTSMAY